MSVEFGKLTKSDTVKQDLFTLSENHQNPNNVNKSKLSLL